MTTTRSLPSPIGDLLLVADGGDLIGVYFPDHRPAPRLDAGVSASASADPVLDEVAGQLGEWFAGGRTTFDLPMRPRGSDFQLAVWACLAEIPFGATTTYGSIAAGLGRPGAARAIGHAVARNPLSIVVPCHRVVGTSGKLTGYAGGMDRKGFLLRHEGVLI